jgi:diaminopimelate epimerase
MSGLTFARMHGCGNDFVVIDDRTGRWRGQRSGLARALCDRRQGIGGDGLILIDYGDSSGADATRNDKDADFRMTYVNADGMDGEMCGNGARCAIHRAADLGMIGAKSSMSTPAGMIRAAIDGAVITLDMTPPIDERPPQSLEIVGRAFDFYYIDTGVPHVVAFVEDLEKLDVARLGPIIRHHDAFQPRGVNANFAKRMAPNRYRLRTYERGVEAETLACGTGSVAVALIAHRRYGDVAPITIVPTGSGLLSIGFSVAADGAFREVTLGGPAEIIAEGSVSESWLEARGLAAAGGAARAAAR